MHELALFQQLHGSKSFVELAQMQPPHLRCQLTTPGKVNRFEETLRLRILESCLMRPMEVLPTQARVLSWLRKWGNAVRLSYSSGFWIPQKTKLGARTCSWNALSRWLWHWPAWAIFVEKAAEVVFSVQAHKIPGPWWELQCLVV